MRRFSKRSTIAPAKPAPRTTGPQSAKISAETANAEPVRCWTCRISGKIAMKSPSAEMPGGAGEQAEVAAGGIDMAPIVPGDRSRTVRPA